MEVRIEVKDNKLRVKKEDSIIIPTQIIDNMGKKRMEEIDGDKTEEQKPKTFEDIRKHLAEKK